MINLLKDTHYWEKLYSYHSFFNRKGLEKKEEMGLWYFWINPLPSPVFCNKYCIEQCNKWMEQNVIAGIY